MPTTPTPTTLTACEGRWASFPSTVVIRDREWTIQRCTGCSDVLVISQGHAETVSGLLATTDRDLVVLWLIKANAR